MTVLFKISNVRLSLISDMGTGIVSPLCVCRPGASRTVPGDSPYCANIRRCLGHGFFSYVE